jgi:hypothetical protein
MDIAMDKNNNVNLRAGELGQPPIFRSNRFFAQENYWYFRTREGLDIGPFDSLSYAKEGLNGFLSFLQQAHNDVVTKITKYIKLQPRKKEITDIPARAERVFEQNDFWYFRTREGMDIGPFDNRGDTVVGAKGFINFLEESQPDVVTRVTNYIRSA